MPTAASHPNVRAVRSNGSDLPWAGPGFRVRGEPRRRHAAGTPSVRPPRPHLRRDWRPLAQVRRLPLNVMLLVERTQLFMLLCLGARAPT